jgi:hypothetical protein
VHEIFSISRFTHLVPIFATIDEACAAWDMPSPPRPAERRDDGKPDPNAPLRVRFWGTRGSLPAPLRESAIRSKIRDALLAARGQTLDTPEAIDSFIDDALPFSVRGTYGGNTSCVEIITGSDEYVLCDLEAPVYASSAIAFCASTAAVASKASISSSHIPIGTTSWGSRFSLPLTFRGTEFASTAATKRSKRR